MAQNAAAPQPYTTIAEWYYSGHGWDVFLTNEHLDRINLIAVHEGTGEARTVHVSPYRVPNITLIAGLAKFGFPARDDGGYWTMETIREAVFERAAARIDAHFQFGRFAHMWRAVA